MLRRLLRFEVSVSAEPRRSLGRVSALMPVHAGADPRLFAEALDSLATQTRPCDEILVVVDGAVTTAHESVLGDRPTVRVLRLPNNVGVAMALDAGLRAAGGTWIARADADDRNEPERVERQLAELSRTDADVCGTAMTEVVDAKTVGIRRQPTDHTAIARRMRIANPVNHPTAMFDRGRALAVGGYQQVDHLEDYDLWARMLAGGARFTNLPDPLVTFRADGMLDRRTSVAARVAERDLQRRLVDYGLIGPLRARVNVMVRNLFRVLPRPLVSVAYAVVFRRRAA